MLEIVCSTESVYNVLLEARKLENDGYKPIGFASVPKVTGDRNIPGICILMQKE